MVLKWIQNELLAKVALPIYLYMFVESETNLLGSECGSVQAVIAQKSYKLSITGL